MTIPQHAPTAAIVATYSESPGIEARLPGDGEMRVPDDDDDDDEYEYDTWMLEEEGWYK